MSVNYVSYWETAEGQSMPPWIALALVSIKRALGTQFTLLTPSNLEHFIDSSIARKVWRFEPLTFCMDQGIEAIVARSDFIRMAYVHRHGGVWIDADSILLCDPTSFLFPTGIDERLHWYSECLFGSLPGNAHLAESLSTGLTIGAHAWGNPGGIKEIVARLSSHQKVLIPSTVCDPGYRPMYNFASCDLMRRTDIAVSDFLLRDVSLLKLYNTWLKRTSIKDESVADFLDGETLLSRIFLHIEPDRSYWLRECEVMIERYG